jgi:hypothetical protein
MGRVRTWDFEAVIGVGGLSAKPRFTGRQGELDRYRTPKGRQNKRGPIVTFEHFVCFDSDEPNVPDFENWRLCSPGESLGMCEQS